MALEEQERLEDAALEQLDAHLPHRKGDAVDALGDEVGVQPAIQFTYSYQAIHDTKHG